MKKLIILLLIALNYPCYSSNLLGGEMLANMSRTPAIIADAALFILSKEKLQYTGKTFIDEEVLAAEGITDLAHYSVVPGAKLFYDLFL